MKVRSLVCFMVGLAILGASSLPVVAQVYQKDSTKQSRQAIQSLPDGNYFYGQSRSLNQIGSTYLVFRKTGTNIIGIIFEYASEYRCFRGTARSNTITNVTESYVELGDEGKRFFVTKGNKDLSSYHRLRFSNTDNPKTRKQLQECIQVFSNRRLLTLNSAITLTAGEQESNRNE